MFINGKDYCDSCVARIISDNSELHLPLAILTCDDQDLDDYFLLWIDDKRCIISMRYPKYHPETECKLSESQKIDLMNLLNDKDNWNKLKQAFEEECGEYCNNDICPHRYRIFGNMPDYKLLN